VVVSTGWALLRHSDDDDATQDAKRPCNEANYMRQAFYPLTLPLTVGPFSIAVAITLGANRTEGSEWRWPLIAGLLNRGPGHRRINLFELSFRRGDCRSAG
jgi:multiple antibiotic resistance protein